MYDRDTVYPQNNKVHTDPLILSLGMIDKVSLINHFNVPV